jgi:hypothetical protein
VVKDCNKIIINILVVIAGIFENCSNLAQQDAPLKNKILLHNLYLIYSFEYWVISFEYWVIISYGFSLF